MSKDTAYRILPNETFIGDMYLQFEYNGLWRFIPKEIDAYVLGEYLTKESCPIIIPSHEEALFLHCFYKSEKKELIPFTKKYPDINQYFSHLRRKQKEHLDEKVNNTRDAKIIYL